MVSSTTTQSCIECSNNYYSYNGSCVSSCPTGAISIDSPSKHCTLCSEISNQFKFENTCVSECPVGYSLDAKSSMECIKCTVYNLDNKKCVNDCLPFQKTATQVLSDATLMKTCQTCPVYYNKDTNSCVVECPTNYEPVQGVCIKQITKTQTYYLDSIEVSVCPEGYRADYRNICVKCWNSLCDETCYNPHSSQDRLIKLIDSSSYITTLVQQNSLLSKENKELLYKKLFTFNKDSFSCTRCIEITDNVYYTITNFCETTCPKGYYNLLNPATSETLLCNRCEYFHENNSCVESCSAGYVLTSKKECLKCKEAGLYTQNNVCVSSCSDGFLQNDSEMTCTTCSDETCLNDGSCEVNSSGTGFICTCTDKFFGRKCQYSNSLFSNYTETFSNLETQVENDFEITNTRSLNLTELNLLKEYFDLSKDLKKDKSATTLNRLNDIFRNQMSYLNYLATGETSTIDSTNSTDANTTDDSTNSTRLLQEEPSFSDYQISIISQSNSLLELFELYLDNKPSSDVITEIASDSQQIAYDLIKKVYTNVTEIRNTTDSWFISNNQLLKIQIFDNVFSLLNIESVGAESIVENNSNDVDTDTTSTETDANTNTTDTDITSTETDTNTNTTDTDTTDTANTTDTTNTTDTANTTDTNTTVANANRRRFLQSTEEVIKGRIESYNPVLIDYSTCNSNTKIYSLTNIVNSVIFEPSSGFTNGLIPSDRIMNSDFISEEGEKQDLNCDYIDYYFPIKATNSEIKASLNLYENILQQNKADIFNQTDSFFNSFCNPFSLNNHTDTTYKMRRNMFKYYLRCSSECKYKGIRELELDSISLQYSICRCPSSSVGIYSEFYEGGYTEEEETYYKNLLSIEEEEEIFKPYNKTNVRIIDCASKTLQHDNIGKNEGFWIVFIQSIITLIAVGLYFVFKPSTNLFQNQQEIIMSEIKDRLNVNYNDYCQNFLPIRDKDIENKEEKESHHHGRGYLSTDKDKDPENAVAKINQNNDSEKKENPEKIDSERNLNINEKSSEKSIKTKKIVDENNKNDEDNFEPQIYDKNFTMKKETKGNNNNKKESNKQKDELKKSSKNRLNTDSFDYYEQNTGFINEIILDFKYNHSVFNLVFNFSQLYPVYLRILILSFSCTLELLIICCFFTDGRIEKRADYGVINGFESLGILYSFRHETQIAVYATLISLLIFFILNLLIKVFHSQKKEVFSALKSRNPDEMQEI